MSDQTTTMYSCCTLAQQMGGTACPVHPMPRFADRYRIADSIGTMAQQLAQPRYFLIRLDDSDGNDNTVCDVLVGPCQTKDDAYAKLDAYIAQRCPDLEDDGNGGGYYPCDCVCEHQAAQGCDIGAAICDDCGQSWECSHGGISVSDDPEEYATLAELRAAKAFYHSEIDLTDDESEG